MTCPPCSMAAQHCLHWFWGEEMGVWDLEGKRALITGATKGIGFAIAEEFLRLGAAVLICSRTDSDVQQTVETLSVHGQINGVVADVSTPSGRQLLLAALDAQWPDGMDVLVNNVGTNLRKTTLDYELADLRSLMAVNVESAWALSQQCHGRMLRRGAGAIVNVSSVSSVMIVPTSTAAYAMTKGALDQMTRFMAVEWAGEGIRVNSVHPWYIRTPLAEQVLKDPQKKQRIIGATPMGRIGEPAEVARTVAFLAMEASGYVTGTHLVVDGGFSRMGLPR